MILPDRALAAQLLATIDAAPVNNQQLCVALMLVFDELSARDNYLMPIMLNAWLNNREELRDKEPGMQ